MENEDIRKDFEIFNNTDVAYLDSAATTQRPKQVIDAVKNYYNTANANPHRGNYALSLKSTEVYDEARSKVAKFINAQESREIVFSKNATEALNMLAYSYGMQNLQKGDKVVISILEHHANLVPWQRVTKQKEAKLEYMYINDEGQITDEEIEKKITPGTKIVGITHVSNVLGTITPVEKIIKKAHSVGAVVVLDASQSVPHRKVDVQKLDADFVVFSGHKMLAPLGIGVLYGKAELLEKMPPFLLGGDMIEYVQEQSATFAEIPTRFEAGTQNVGGAIGLAAAIDYLQKIGMEKVEKIEQELLIYAKEQLENLSYVTVYGPKDINQRASVISFNVKNIHPHDVSSILDSVGVAIRAGDHCAQPLIHYMHVPATCRASFYIYNTKADVDRLILGLNKTYEMFKKWI